jgi:hypothetical protein
MIRLAPFYNRRLTTARAGGASSLGQPVRRAGRPLAAIEVSRGNLRQTPENGEHQAVMRRGVVDPGSASDRKPAYKHYYNVLFVLLTYQIWSLFLDSVRPSNPRKFEGSLCRVTKG